VQALITIFRQVRDPRDINARHDCASMLFIALMATLCGAKNCVDIADFAAANERCLAEIVDLPHGAPSLDSFSRSRGPAAVMAGLVPAIHARQLRNFRRTPAIDGFGAGLAASWQGQVAVAGTSTSRQPSEKPRRVGVDGRDKPGHDVVGGEDVGIR
jgi:hypothetical protein